MRSLLLPVAPLLFAGVLAVPLARADVYTWTDPSGRLNVSNIAPPEGVHVSSVVHEDPPKPRPNPPPARDEVQALTERVAQLEDQIDRAKQPPVLPPVVYRPAPPAPPVLVNVTVMPSPPANPYPPSYAGYSPYPYPGYPGLPYDQCDPTIFGCPIGYGLPVGVVVLKTPRSRFKHFDRFEQPPGAQHFVTRPAAVPPAMHMRAR